MVNVTNQPGHNTIPAEANLPEIAVLLLASAAQYTYASPSGVVNDVNAGFPNVTGRVRVAVTLAAGSAAWTGLGAGADNQEIVLWNSDSTNNLTLVVNNVGSVHGNRFMGSAGSYTAIPGNSYLLIYYGNPIDAWVIIP